MNLRVCGYCVMWGKDAPACLWLHTDGDQRSQKRDAVNLHSNCKDRKSTFQFSCTLCSDTSKRSN